jgi:hypothetical protein
MQARGLPPHAGLVGPGVNVCVGCGRTVRVGMGGNVTRRVLVMIRRVLVIMRRVLVTGPGMAGGSPHLPDRQVMSRSQSFSVSQGSPGGGQVSVSGLDWGKGTLSERTSAMSGPSACGIGSRLGCRSDSDINRGGSDGSCRAGCRNWFRISASARGAGKFAVAVNLGLAGDA